MYLDIASAERIGTARRRCCEEPVANPHARASLMDRWRAFLRRLHEIACLPELGGCEEELIDIRFPGERTIAERR